MHFLIFLNLTTLNFRSKVFKINIELFKLFLESIIVFIISFACKDPITFAVVPRIPSSSQFKISSEGFS